MAGSKEYQAVLQLGTETETHDPEGRVVHTAPVPALAEEDLRVCLSGFIGLLKQTPPSYSALKHRGKPLYYYARRGIRVEKEPREIHVYSLRLGGYDPGRARLHLTVRCSRGTYIRVLAADIGRKLGCGAHLVALRRLASGGFSVADALPGQKLEGPDNAWLLRQAMMTPMEALTVFAESPAVNRS
jgi:tRNA pseudouridine55 synthase